MSKGTISWFSNSPDAPTGYGVQTNQVVKRLIADSYDVAIQSNYGREGVIGEVKVGDSFIREYPRGSENYSQDVAPLNHQHWKLSNVEQPDLWISLYDVWILKGNKYSEMNIASWTPVDHYPCPPDVMKWLSRPNVTPLAMSKFGQTAIGEQGVDSDYVPHAVEKVFRPTLNVTVELPNGLVEVVNTREWMGLGGGEFVVGMNAANKANGLVHRKAFAENVLAFSIFAKNKKDVVLYLHTDMFGSQSGWNMTNLLEACGLKSEQVVFVDQVAYRHGINQDSLAGIYTAMDVYLGTSYGEGFGVGTIEAQACGTPVIVSNFAASAELCGDGWLVEGQPFWDAHQRSWFNTPSVISIVDALEQAYARGQGRSSKAVQFAKQFDADFVYENHWKPVLARLLK